jgi:translation elongation factor EF-1alpha
MTLAAHHGTGNSSDTRVITTRATVTKFIWLNPHIQIGFTIMGNNGLEEWNVEGDPVNMMAETGWSKKSIKPGDVITISFNPSKNGAKVGYALKVVTADGTCLPRSASWVSLCEK